MATASQGIYRIPYQAGTTVKITRDHLTHDPPTRIDMKGKDGGERYRIVAAADGGAGLLVGQRVKAGTFLGFEGDVGCASGQHLHFEVGVPKDPENPIDSQGFLRGGSDQNRIPRICGIPAQIFVEGTGYQVGHALPGSSEYALHDVSEARYQQLWEEPAATVKARHGLSSAQYRQEWESNRAQGWSTQAVTGYEEGATYATPLTGPSEPGFGAVPATARASTWINSGMTGHENHILRNGS